MPVGRTLTINGTTYDLSADRSWTVSGGVTGTTGTTANRLLLTTSTDGVITNAFSTGTYTGSLSIYDGLNGPGFRLTQGASSVGFEFQAGGILRLIGSYVALASNNIQPQYYSVNDLNLGATDGGCFVVGAGTNATSRGWWRGAGGFHVTGGYYAMTTAGSAYVYNTYTSNTSYERLNIAWVSNICTIGTEAGSAGGSIRTLQLLGCPSTAAGYGTAGSLLISGGVYSGVDTAGVNAGDVTISTADTASRGLSLPGTITIKGGDATGNRSSTTNTNAGHIFITAGTALTSTETTNSGRGASGGRVDVTTGAGGSNSVTGGFGRAGGRFYVSLGSGGAGTGASGTGGLGGIMVFISGSGGSGTAVGGGGGGINLNGGTGGSGTATGGVGGSGATVYLTGGGGGTGGLNGQNGDGGDVYLTGGFSPPAMNGALQGNHGRVVFSLAGNQKVLWRWNYVQFLDTTNTVPPAGYDFEFGTTYGTKLGTAANQKLAFFGSTPIVQRTPSSPSAAVVSPGAGNVIKTDDTFGGYTIAQAIQAMIDFGFLFKP